MAMRALQDIPGTHIKAVYVPAVTAGTDKKYPLFRAEADITITAAYFIPQANITGQDTNTMTVKVINAGTDGSGTTLIASKAYTSGNNATALKPEALTLSTTAANLDIDAGEVIAYFNDQAGTGLNCPEGVIEVHFQYK